MIVSFFLFTAALTGSIVAGRFLMKRLKSWDWIERLIASYLPATLLTVLMLLGHKIATVIYDEHSWIRFEKTFMVALGYPLYYGPAAGPAIAAIYGPVSVLAYLPATLTHSPELSLRIAEAIAIGFFFLPVLWLCTAGTLKDKPLFAFALTAFLCFCFLAILLTNLRNAAFTVHADAPTLGLCALACACLYFRKNPNHWGALLGSSIFVILAVWSKQVAVPLILALSLYVFLADGWPTLKRFLLCLLIAGILISGLFLMIYNPHDMLFNMFTLPSRHPLKDGGWVMVLQAFFRMFRETLLILVIAYFSLRPLIPSKDRPVPFSNWVQSNPWFLFVIVGILMMPISIWSSIKVGGSNNTLSYPNYFLLITLILGMITVRRRNLSASLPLSINIKKMTAILTSILLCIQIPAVFYRIATVGSQNNFAKLAYNYIKAHPGKSYFPRLTLLHLLAEGKVYHTIDGLMDRHWAGFPVEGEHLQAHIPRDTEIIAFSGEDHKWLLPLEGFSTGYQDFEELPGFVVYLRNKIQEGQLPVS